jgi:cytochrome oxidase Cu insertion factor (SCO1/SenC/PrrC family)
MRILKLLGIAALGLVIICGAATAWFAARLHPDVEPGTASPDVALTTPDEGSLPLSSLRGKVVLLDFWSST